MTRTGLWRAWPAGVLLAMAAPVAPAFESEFFATAELSAFDDDNSSRASFRRDRIEDAGGLLAAGATWRQEHGAMLATSVEAYAEGEAHDHVDMLDRRGLGLRAGLQWQTRLGYTAPLYSLSLAVQDDDYDDDARDSSLYVLQAFANRRFTDQLSGTAGVEGTLRDSAGTVFDTGQGRLFLSGDWAFSDAWALYATWSLIEGDTFSSAQRSFCNGALAPDIYPLLAAAEAVEPDRAFDDATCGSWLAYRLEASTQTVAAGLNRRIGHAASLDLSALYADIAGDGGIDYDRTLLRASLLARF